MATTPVVQQDGVYFDLKDCAGFLRRTSAAGIDGLVLIGAWYGMAFGWSFWDPMTQFEGLTLVWCLVIFLYLGPLKVSRARTIGYRFLGLRVVDLWGGRPSMGRMFLRTFLLMLGFSLWLWPHDLLLMFSLPDRRKLTDLFAGTTVVRTRANPQGQGPIVLAYYDVMGYFLIFGEVRRPSKPRPTGLD
jgi:uncharacterized RDD family membrane protein YckC